MNFATRRLLATMKKSNDTIKQLDTHTSEHHTQDTILRIREDLKKKLRIHLSQMGFALHCDFIFYGRENIFNPKIEELNNAIHGSKIFLGCEIDHYKIPDISGIASILSTKKIKVYF